MKAMVIGFPKTGTTTIQVAFNRSGLRSVHWTIKQSQQFVGELIYRGHFEHADPFFFLSAFDCISQSEVCLPAKGLNYWPNLDFAMLRRIRQQYPDCLFILNTRPVSKTIDSISRWYDMRERFISSDITGLPVGRGKTDEELKIWISGHYEACRTYFKDDPKFVELDIENSNAPEVLSQALGHKITWWGIAPAGQGELTEEKL